MAGKKRTGRKARKGSSPPRRSKKQGRKASIGRSTSPARSRLPGPRWSSDASERLRGLARFLVSGLALLGVLGLAAGPLALPGAWLSRFWWQLWGWLTPLTWLGLGYWALYLGWPSRLSGRRGQVGAALLGLLGLGGWLAVLSPEAAGLWGQWLWRLLRTALGAPGAYVVLTAWLSLSLVWIWNRPIWPLVQQGLQWARLQAQRRRHWWQHRSKTATSATAAPASLQRSTPAPNPLAKAVPASAPLTRQAISRSSPSPQSAEPLSPSSWQLPPWDEVLDPVDQPQPARQTWAQQQARVLEETLAHFGVPARVVTIQHGPTVTLFGVEPGYVTTKKGRTRVRVSKILALADDLALALAAKRLRIQAPVPGRPYVGIEVPNEKPALVPLARVLRSEEFQKQRFALPLALGEDVAGQPVVASLETMPHLLIAGATGSGKSVCLQAMLVTWLLTRTPDQVRLLLIDPKRVELTRFNGLPHLLAPVVTDLEKAQGALQWALEEMDRRYRLLAESRVRSLEGYNQKRRAQGKSPLPYLVVMVDELADLMMLSPQRTEQALVRLAQLARATGIHLVVATQRPSVDVVTGLIKANFPARIAFAVASGVDSRVILDRPGAERLLGKGDMLFLPPDATEPRRVQGAFITESEVRRVVQFWLAQSGPQYQAMGKDRPLPTLPEAELEAAAQPQDPLLEAARDLVHREGRVSITLLQRHLGIGYTRAARLVEQLKARGWVPQASFSKPEAAAEGEAPSPNAGT